MKKRSFVILVILALVMGGVFAAPIDAGLLATAGTPTATLKAIIGEYLNHGFHKGGDQFLPTIEVTDAFHATNFPAFTYGYATNAVGTFDITMTVNDFENGTSGASGTVAIASVEVSGGGILSSDKRDYKLFVYDGDGSDAAAEKTITIKVYQNYTTGDKDLDGNAIVAENTVAGAQAGEYTAEITFTISGS